MIHTFPLESMAISMPTVRSHGNDLFNCLAAFKAILSTLDRSLEQEMLRRVDWRIADSIGMTFPLLRLRLVTMYPLPATFASFPVIRQELFFFL